MASCSGEIPVIKTLQVSDITANSAMSGGIIVDEGSGAINERGVCWSVDAYPTLSSDRTIDGSGAGEFSSNITGLMPATLYHVRAFASNKVGTSYGNEITFTTSSSDGNTGSRIIADHTVVDKFDEIPQVYIDEVKKMLVWVAGMSHSLGYQNGVNLLESLDSKYQVITWLSEPPPASSESYLRLGRPWMSNVNFWTTDVASYCSVAAGQNSTGNPFTVIINGWSYETTWNNAPGGGLDPVYKVHWAGDAGNGRWGLDAEDRTLTGNSTCMDTYLSAIEAYNSYFSSNNIPSIAIFSTGPVDENAGTESGFQRELKNSHIREYVAKDGSRILFDYADILVHNNAGQKYTVNWNDGGTLRPHSQIHPDNLKDYDSSWNVITSGDTDGDHIGEVGALRIAKATWWMLARIAGWNGM